MSPTLSALASPADLEGADAGNGRVTLRWTHPDDIAAQGILFDVYVSEDPLDPFRARPLAGLDSTSATLGGFERGGNFFFVVVARRDAVMSLPSRVVSVPVEAVSRTIEVAASGGGGLAPAGLGFPFQIDGAGRVFADQGDSLLRGKILQFLLTSPGERVNLPEYGTRLRDLVFDPNNDVLAAATEFAVRRGIERFLGDEVHVDKVRIESLDSELQVEIEYLRKADLQTERLRVGIPIPQ